MLVPKKKETRMQKFRRELRNNFQKKREKRQRNNQNLVEAMSSGLGVSGWEMAREDMLDRSGVTKLLHPKKENVRRGARFIGNK